MSRLLRARVRVIVTVLCLLSLGLPSVPGAAAAPANQTPPSPPGARSVPNQVLVQFKPGVSETDRSSARSGINASLREVVADSPATGRGRLELVEFPGGPAMDQVIRTLENHPAVLFAERNWVYTRQVDSNDPYYTNGSLWGMYGDASSPANQYGSQAAEAWAAGYTGGTGSSSVYVGVIDEGIQDTHPDLSANIWTNPYELANGQDDDGNGYVDDIHGWDFYSNNNSIYDGTGDDHGTHVTGTIGARGGNSVGVAGVNWNVTIISAKFLGSAGGSTSNAIKAVDYITNLKTLHGLNIVATSNSWGGGGYSQGLYDAIQRANSASILFVAAAGNNSSNNDSSTFYPASYTNSNLISVAAIADNGSLASFSNYGATSVDLGAPGVSINSTLPDKTYGSYSGTSMATPHVSGAAALYKSVNTGATAAQIKDAILSSATPTASLAGKTVSGGRLNVCALLGGLTTCTLSTHDVAVTGLTAPTSPMVGQPYDVSVQVANQGTFSEIFTVSLGDTAGSTIGSSQSVTLAAGATGTATISWTPSVDGPHILTATASTVSSETDTADNTKTANVTVQQPVHDVAVTGITAPGSPTVNQTYNIGVNLANQGTFSESFTVSLGDTAGSTIGPSQPMTLAAGASANVTFSWTPSAAGTHTLTATASTVSSETDTADNSQQASLTVTSPPATPTKDAAVTNINGPASVNRGTNALYKVTVKNQGSSTASFSVTFRNDTTGATIGTKSVSSLAPGSSTTLNFKWSVSSSTVSKSYTLTARASLAEDSNATNDWRSIVVQVN